MLEADQVWLNELKTSAAAEFRESKIESLSSAKLIAP